jgi:hypothetical protein
LSILVDKNTCLVVQGYCGLKGINYLDSSLRVETLSLEEAADFNPQEWFI